MLGRVILAVAIAFSASTLVQAESCGSSGSPDVLSFEGWAAERQETAIGMTIRVRSTAQAPIKMIDGVVWLRDALGEPLGGIKVERDLHIMPGAVYEQHFHVTEDRFLKASPTDISGIACVKSVLYEDGTKTTF